jgi:hypothetical protein
MASGDWAGYHEAQAGREPRELLSWASDPDMTFQDARAAKELFEGLEVESFEEEEEDGEAFDGPKHWHVFHVIAREPTGR